MITIEMNGKKFDVSVNGSVYQPENVSQFLIDEVRLSASKQFLFEGSLTREQREYWSSVSKASQLMNFVNPSKFKTIDPIGNLKVGIKKRASFLTAGKLLGIHAECLSESQVMGIQG